MGTSDSMAVAWLWRIAPGALLLALAVLGWFWEGAAYLALLGLTTCVGFALFFALGVLAIVKRPRVPAIAGALLMLSASVVSGEVTFGTPHWVRARAAPALSALAGWRRANGRFPEVETFDARFPRELQGAFQNSGCSYRPKPGGFDLFCHGVLFTTCVYDSQTARWHTIA
jgi:hypothetical protein